VIVAEPGTTTPLVYREGITHIQIKGTVCNSALDISSAGEIKSLSWGVVGKIWGGVLDLTSGSTDFDAASGTYITTNTGFYINESFTFNPQSLDFSTGFDVPYGAGSLLPLAIVAEDYNGHQTTISAILYADEAGPQITITSPAAGAVTYYSPVNFAPLRVTGNVLDHSTVTNMDYKLQASDFSPLPVEISLTGPGFVNFQTTGDFWFDLDGLSGVLGPVTVTITAANAQGNVSRPVFTMLADGIAPAIDSVAIDSSNANALFARIADTVTLNFTVTEAASGIEGKPKVMIAGNLIPDAQVVALGNDNYRATHVMAAGEGTDAPVTFAIDAIQWVSARPTQGTVLMPLPAIRWPCASPACEASSLPLR
jgi:hypothetical protein